MTAILLDIDGVLHVSGEVIPGAAEAVARLREQGHRLRFLTNNTTRARNQLAEELRGIGFALVEDEVQTTPLAAAQLLAGLRDDLATQVQLVEERAEVVLVGGADETDETGRVFAWNNLNRAFAELRAGARLVCLHKNRWWQTSRGPLLDAGAVVAGLEYACGARAEVIGKPSAAYFEAALLELAARPEEAIMVGDDVDSDIVGAKALRLRAVLVRTGKFREEALRHAQWPPDAVLDSIADLPPYLEELM